MPQGTPVTVMTPSQHAKHYLASALDVTPGTLWPCLGTRKTTTLFRELLDVLEECYPAPQYRRLYVVVDNCNIHKAKAVGQWLAGHPRVQLLFLPPYCPRANPIERAFGDVHDQCTLFDQHLKVRLGSLFQGVQRFFSVVAPRGAAREHVNPRAPAAVFFLLQFRMEDIGLHGDPTFREMGDTRSVHRGSIPSCVVSSTSAAIARCLRQRPPRPGHLPRLVLALPCVVAVLWSHTRPLARLGLGQPMGAPPVLSPPRQPAALARRHRLASPGS